MNVSLTQWDPAVSGTAGQADAVPRLDTSMLSMADTIRAQPQAVAAVATRTIIR